MHFTLSWQCHIDMTQWENENFLNFIFSTFFRVWKFSSKKILSLLWKFSLTEKYPFSLSPTTRWNFGTVKFSHFAFAQLCRRESFFGWYYKNKKKSKYLIKTCKNFMIAKTCNFLSVYWHLGRSEIFKLYNVVII